MKDDPTFKGLVVDDTCLLSIPSSSILMLQRKLLFFLSRFDLHWTSVSKPIRIYTKIHKHILELC